MAKERKRDTQVDLEENLRVSDHIVSEASRLPLGVVVVPYLLTYLLRLLVVDSGHIKAQHRFLFLLDSGLWKKEVLLSHLAQVESSLA